MTDEDSSNQARTDRAFKMLLWLPMLLLLGCSILINLLDLDRACSRVFWMDGSTWYLADSPIARFLYRFGTWPAIAAGAIGTLFWITAPILDYGAQIGSHGKAP
jgi:hypothetical protein